MPFRLIIIGGPGAHTRHVVNKEMALARLSRFRSNVCRSYSHRLLDQLYAETLELGRITTSGNEAAVYQPHHSQESERLTALKTILDFPVSERRKEYDFRKH